MDKNTQMVSGIQIDTVVEQTKNNNHTIKQQLKDTIRERDQYKKLYEKLV